MSSASPGATRSLRCGGLDGGECLEAVKQGTQQIGIRFPMKAELHRRVEATIGGIERFIVDLPPQVAPLDDLLVEHESRAQRATAKICVDGTHQERHPAVAEVARFITKQPPQALDSHPRPRPCMAQWCH